MEVAHTLTQPSPFNTAPLVHGLLMWSRAAGGREALTAARRGADSLVSVQDPDGAWRRHCYADTAASYTAHLSCWLAELGQDIGEPRYLDAAARHLDWVMQRCDPETGWFDGAGFGADWHRAREAFTHPTAYTLHGGVISSQILGPGGRLDAVARA